MTRERAVELVLSVWTATKPAASRTTITSVRER
jgi:hypothetical protein